MAAFTSIAIAVGIGAAVVGGAIAVSAAQKQAKAAKQAAAAQQQAVAAQQKQQEVQQRASQIRATRISQIEAARARAGAAAFGGLESSGYRGGQAAIGSRLGFGLGVSTQLSGLSDEITMYSQRAADFSAKASKAGAMAGLGMKLFQFGVGQLGGGFGGSPTPATIPSTAMMGYQPPMAGMPSWAL